ncbi:hypothetical protein GGR52DRAFT_584701 [Hypoxylon sp. FL1284]|nr:hypothetical protein GGR52DRAFT_584701 [Hypoxylon sp. FL1284]
MQTYHHDNTRSPDKVEEPPTIDWSMSSQPLPGPPTYPLPSAPEPLPPSRSTATVEHVGRRRSNTWTSSNGDPLLLSEGDQVEDRGEFVKTYNRLANKYGIRQLVPEDFSNNENASRLGETRKISWVARAIRRTSSGQSTKAVINRTEDRQLRRRRSISDAALDFVHHQRKDGLKNKDLKALVRLCGKSLLFLPQGYTLGPLVLPTCFRAVAQALVQHAGSRGLFRIPGSVRVVNTIYDYYSADKDTENIATTTRHPDLPAHIRCGPHDIASALKKFLSGLPGGILGSLALFDALVAIHHQLQTGPERSKTRQSKLRARLIALAISTVESQYQRELICGVFGLLCLVGRTAETTEREDEDGRPLPTTDLMGYNALGIVFGPLLVNDLIDSYRMEVADPAAGLVLLPGSSPTSRREKHRCKHKKPTPQSEASSLVKIHIANGIAEMVIMHWREVVRQMRSVGTLKIRRHEGSAQQDSDGIDATTSASDTYSLKKPPMAPGRDEHGKSRRQGTASMAASPTPSPTTRLSPTVEESPSTSNSLTGLAQAIRPVESVLARRFENTSEGPSLRTNVAVGESEPEDKTSKGGEYVRSRRNPLPTGLRMVKSELHGGSLPDHDQLGDETTLYGLRSAIAQIGNDDEPLALAEHSFENPATSNRPISLTRDLAGTLIDTRSQHPNPLKRREVVARISEASTESLPLSMKERRLKRVAHYASLSRSEENSRLPEGGRPLTRKRGEEKRPQQPAKLSPKKKSIFEISPLVRSYRAAISPQKSRIESPDNNGIGGGSGVVSQRSSSRPIAGAVKTMTALFKRPAREAPAGPTRIPPRRRASGSVATSEIISPYPYIAGAPPLKASRSGASLNVSSGPRSFISSVSRLLLDAPPRVEPANTSNVSLAPSSHVAPRDTPITPAPVSLLPTAATYIALRKAPPAASTEQAAPPQQNGRELGQPPSLGTMVPHVEEPPVAQHISFPRPARGASPTEDECAGSEGSDGRSPARPGSSGNNSVLHARIRSLRRHLVARTEECTQLRRQLAAREDADSAGRLCEQLRAAQRECRVWRGRAQAAERRVAVLEKFTARVRRLRDGVAEEEGEEMTTTETETGTGVDQIPAGDGQVDGGVGAADRNSAVSSVSDYESKSSYSSDRTASDEELRERIRGALKARAESSSSGSTRKDKGKGVCRQLPAALDEHDGDDDDGRTARLWDLTEELLALEGEIAGGMNCESEGEGEGEGEAEGEE